uniref:Uncharacterized protein n=1 Tax=Ciona savignyi TaxID=51511 RepID=H2ZDS1_CIOSA
MPSPSRIPRCIPKANVCKKEIKLPMQENVDPQSKKNAKNADIPEIVLPPYKKKKAEKHFKQQQQTVGSPPAKHNGPPKKTGADRRGISEIKRSEQTLQVKLKEIESELEDTKLNFTHLKHVNHEKENDIMELKLNETKLIEEKEKLTAQKLALVEKLENMNFDPISGTQMKIDDKFFEEMESSKKEAAGNVEDMLRSLAELDKMYDDTQHVLDSITLPEL